MLVCVIVMCRHKYEPEIDRFKFCSAWQNVVTLINQTEVQNVSVTWLHAVTLFCRFSVDVVL